MKRSMLLCFYILFSLKSFSQKRVLDHSTPSEWPFITSQKISNDGKYISYSIGLEIGDYTKGTDKDSVLIVKAIDRSWEKTISNIKDRGVFTQNSRMFIFHSAGDSIGILDLENDHLEYIGQIKSFNTPDKGEGEWLACLLAGPEKILLIRNLITGNEVKYPNVENYLFSPDARSMVIQTGAEKDTAIKSALLWVDLNSNHSTCIWRGFRASHFAFDGLSKQFAFLSEEEVAGHPIFKAWIYASGIDRAGIVVDNNSPGMGGIKVSDGDVVFSDDGLKLFFYVKKVDTVLRRVPESGAPVTVWNYKDTRLLFGKQVTDFLAVCKLREDNQVVRLLGETDDFSRYKYSWGSGYSNDYLLFFSNILGDYREGRWRVSARPDLYLVSTTDGSRALVKSRVQAMFYGFSPGGRYVLWYDRVQNHIFAYDVTTKVTRNITAKIKTQLYYINDHPDLPQAEGLAGWMDGDGAVLVYDRYDIWKVDPSGVRDPVNITKRNGATDGTRFRYLEFKGEQLTPLSNKDTILLSAFNLKSKDNGFFKLSLNGSGGPVKLIMSPKTYYFPFTTQMTPAISGICRPLHPLKAKRASVYLLSEMSASECPNLYTTNDFSSFKQLTTLEPQKKFNWYTTELVHWKLFDGKIGEGILYKPENFDPGRKYPIIFYYYENMSDALHLFLNPELSNGVVNIPWLVSNGYLVFTPEIYFKDGFPGRSAYNSVVSAAEYFAKKPWVNAKKMGIQGHSYGGFETNYIVSHSSLFAAAGTAAGISNVISEYDRFERSTGSQWFYETRQGRLGATLWQNPALYIENSAVFKADKVTTPLLILHNKGDGTVLFRQSSEFYSALNRLGKKVWMLSYAGEGHTVEDPINKMDFSIRLGQFFNYYLKDGFAPNWMTKGEPDWLKGIENGLAPDTSGAKP